MCIKNTSNITVNQEGKDLIDDIYGVFIGFGIKLVCFWAYIYNLYNFMTEAEEPVPTTKQQLIEMLKTQLQKVQDQITEMQNNLQEQRDKRKQLTEELQQKEQKIKELIQNESKTLGDKVHEGLYKTLETANKMRAEADAEARKLAEENTQLNENIINHDNILIEDRIKIMLNTKKISALEQKKIDAQRRQQNLTDKKEEVKKDLQIMKQQLERIEREEKQLRGHLENMKKLRLYLNKNLDSGAKANQSSLRVNKSNINDNFWNGQ